MASKSASASASVQVVHDVSFEQKRPDEILSVTLAPRAKKTVTWAEDVQDSERCRHCCTVNRKERKKYTVRSRPRPTIAYAAPTRKYFKALVTHFLP